MRRFIRLLLIGSAVVSAIAAVVLATILAAPGGASAQTGTEGIISYDTGIAIQRDGSILVTERIVYNFGSDQRHGIIREIPVRLGYNGLLRSDLPGRRGVSSLTGRPCPVHSREQRLLCEHQDR